MADTHFSTKPCVPVSGEPTVSCTVIDSRHSLQHSLQPPFSSAQTISSRNSLQHRLSPVPILFSTDSPAAILFSTDCLQPQFSSAQTISSRNSLQHRLSPAAILFSTDYLQPQFSSAQTVSSPNSLQHRLSPAPILFSTDYLQPQFSSAQSPAPILFSTDYLQPQFSSAQTVSSCNYLQQTQTISCYSPPTCLDPANQPSPPPPPPPTLLPCPPSFPPITQAKRCRGKGGEGSVNPTVSSPLSSPVRGSAVSSGGAAAVVTRSVSSMPAADRARVRPGPSELIRQSSGLQ